MTNNTERLYWVVWDTLDNVWGFPWVWVPDEPKIACAGSRDTMTFKVKCVAVISAVSFKEAISKAGFYAKVEKLISCGPYYGRVEKLPPAYPLKKWWPAPEVVWSHMDDDGYREEFWWDKRK